MRQEYLKAAMNQDFEYFDLNQTGDFASRMSRYIQFYHLSRSYSSSG